MASWLTEASQGEVVLTMARVASTTTSMGETKRTQNKAQNKAYRAKRYAEDPVWRQKQVCAQRVRDEAQRAKRFAEDPVFRQRYA